MNARAFLSQGFHASTRVERPVARPSGPPQVGDTMVVDNWDEATRRWVERTMVWTGTQYSDPFEEVA